MTTYITLLRAINLAGHGQVNMNALREFLTQLGLTDVRTLLQTGNAIFRRNPVAATKLESLLETEAEKHLRLVTKFFVRTAQEWEAILASNPFPEEARADPAHLVVMVLKDAPTAQALAGLQNAIKGREIVRAEGKQLYIVYPDGIGRSRLTTALIESKLATKGTGRNWNTALKLEALAQE